MCFYEIEKIDSISTDRNFEPVSDWLFGADVEIIAYSPTQPLLDAFDEALTPKSLL